MPRTSATLCLLVLLCSAATKPSTKNTRPAMDYGPFLSYSVITDDKKDLTLKGINIRVGPDQKHAICFDTDLLRFAGAWKNGFLDLSKTHQLELKGTLPPSINGTFAFTTPMLPGVSSTDDFTDPRPDKMGPLPRHIAHYKGLYLHGNQVILSYTVGDAKVLELPSAADDSLTRELWVVAGPKTESGTFLLAEMPKAVGRLIEKNDIQASAALQLDDLAIAALVYPDSKGAVLRAEESRLTLQLPLKQDSPTNCTVSLWHGPANQVSKFARTLRPAMSKIAIPLLIKGGPPRWKPLTTRGVPGDNKNAYTVDTLTLPEKNPWNSWIRPTGLDFFPDGRAGLCTLNGDVWIISNIDEKLENLTCGRFATGLYEPLGLVIANDKIYVRGRDQITRLHDLNDDGEADFYENFNNDGAIDAGYHAFAYDLMRDSAGNFYYARGGHWYTPGRRDTNSLFKLSPDGLKTEIVATGFRAPNGLCVGPDDQLFTSDNQGNWMPSSKINLIQKGKFYGFVADPKYTTKETPIPTTYEPPLCWIPTELDNSSGGQCFVADPRFGPLSNHLFHTSYGKSSLFLVLHEQVGDKKIAQGGVVPLKLKFDSGIMRARVNPKDGQLYVAGPKGWQTNGGRDGALQRIRYTGKPARLPTALHIKSNTIQITFTDPLDRTAAADKDNYSIEQWNYRWSAEYGSKDYSVKNPAKIGRDTLDITRADLSPDNKTITLHIAKLAPVMQMKIEMHLKSADGAPVSTTIYNTVNTIHPN